MTSLRIMLSLKYIQNYVLESLELSLQRQHKNHHTLHKSHPGPSVFFTVEILNLSNSHARTLKHLSLHPMDLFFI